MKRTVKRLICRVFGHDWRWRWTQGEYITSYCARCGAWRDEREG